MIRFVYVLYTFLQIPYHNSVYFIYTEFKKTVKIIRNYIYGILNRRNYKELYIRNF